MDFKKFVFEQTEKHAVLAFGRMNPPTTGHEKLVKKVKDIAREVGGTHHVVISHSQDPHKNPLSAEQKLKHAKRFFPDTNLSTSDKHHPNFLSQASKLHKTGVTHLHMVAGSDRTGEYHKLLHKYNGVKGPHGHFNFRHIEVHSAGERDPDAEGTTGMSASKMRAHAHSNNLKEFKKGVPKHVSHEHAKELMNDVRKGMNIKEDFESMLNTILSEGVHDKSIFKAMFLAGGPGSGKDFVLDNTLSGHGLTEINSDKAFEFLLDKKGLDKTMPDSEKEIRNLVRGKAKDMTELRERLALLGRNGLIINGTGDDIEKITKIKSRLEELGYETGMILVNTADEVSQQRNIERGQRGGRTVPEEIRKQKWDAVQKSRPEFAKLFGDNYTEVDNSEDLRTADPQTVAAKKEEFANIFKKVQKFVSAPPKNDISKQWISGELSKKDTMPIDKEGPEKLPPHNSKAAEEAKRLGLQYYGFGRYGKNGKVTHHEVHGQLVQDPQQNMQKENLDGEFENFLTESMSITITADTPEEMKSAFKLLTSKDEEQEVEEQVEPDYELSSSDARDMLTLGKPMEVFESVKHKDGKRYVSSLSKKKPRVYLLRKDAAADAHRLYGKGEVIKAEKGYMVKIKETNDVELSNESILQEETGTSDRRNDSAYGRTSESRAGESGAGASEGASTITIQECTEECSCDATEDRKKPTKYLSKIKEQFTEKTKSKETYESIDKGIEPGLSMSASGENAGRTTLKTKFNKKPFEE